MSPAFSYVDVGQSGVPTGPQPVTVTISRPQTTDTYVTVDTSDPNALTVVGGGVNVLAGETTATVLVNGLQQSADVTLTATLGTSTAIADVRVINRSNESPVVVDLSPASATAAPGTAATFTVTLDMPAPAGGTDVALSISPSSGYGTLPATVNVPAGQLTATFDVTLDAAAIGTGTVTATLGASSVSAQLEAYAGNRGLVINEVDYDQVNADGAEFVELLNNSSQTIDLTNIALVLVNGSNSQEYARYPLGTLGSIAPGQYLVVGADAVVSAAPSGCLTVAMGSSGNYVQNGSPDAVGLVDASTGDLLDAVSYEGGITSGVIAEGTYSFLEGTGDTTGLADSNTADGSISRLPDGADSDDNATDFAFTSAVTPCAANQ
jgi:hypothetical protein